MNRFGFFVLLVTLPVASGATGSRANITYADAKPVLEGLRPSFLPPELKATDPTLREGIWAAWVSQRDREIRARLARGNDDTVINFLLYGTTFTERPRTTERDIARLSGRESRAGLLADRTEDFIAGVANPGSNDRLRLARQVIEDRGIDPMTPAGAQGLRQYLAEGLARVAAEIRAIDQAMQDAQRSGDAGAERLERATLFRNRGLSSDTSIFSAFVVEQGLAAIRAAGLLNPESVRRMAIVGPGLDFIDKRDGFDFYPQQSLQPFAAIDALARTGLANLNDLRVTTFDLNPRINGHLEAARVRANAGMGYVLQLARDMDLPWSPALVGYWRRLGDRLGRETTAIVPPATAGDVKVRAVNSRPEIARAIWSQDLNIVLQRLELPSAEARFDVIIATDILVYYDVFEQLLTLANVAAMLRPGGLFLSNTPVVELPGIPIASVGYNDVRYLTQPEIGDRLIWYQRR